MIARFFPSLRLRRVATRLGAIALVLVSLGGCALWNGTAARPKPADLGLNVPVVGVRHVWSVDLGAASGIPLVPHASGDAVTVASTRGTVLSIDALSGSVLWRWESKTPLTAGVGGDGTKTAVVSQTNEVILLDGGREQWRERLGAQTYTPPR